MAHTRIGTSLLEWSAFRSASYRARALYLALYASAPARRLCPGLFHGGVAAMADAAGMPVAEADAALKELVTAGLADHDPEARLTTLTLPDKEEAPYNGSIIKAWYRRWSDLPTSPLKGRWVETLRWLISGRPNASNLSAFEACFGCAGATAQVQWSEVGRGSTPCAEADPPVMSKGTEQIPYVKDHFTPPPEAKSRPEWVSARSEACSKEVSRTSGTMPGTVPGTVGIRVRDTRSPSGSVGEGVQGGRDDEAGNLRAAPESGSWGVDDLLRIMREESGGRVSVTVYDRRLERGLGDLLKECRCQGVTRDDVVRAAHWLKAGGLHYRHDLDVAWLARPGAFLGAVAKARDWAAAGAPPLVPASERNHIGEQMEILLAYSRGEKSLADDPVASQIEAFIAPGMRSLLAGASGQAQGAAAP